MKQLPECTDAPEVAFLLESIQGDLAYDVGANIGQSANILARQFRQVESFEPCVESFDVLRHKVPANVSARCLAVSDRDGMVLLAETERPTHQR